jgi:hypothetical protein
MSFSYKEYISIINRIKAHIPIMSFDSISSETEKYCVIRHDVEFSIQRALMLAMVERDLGISSTYVYQISNNNYNPFSHKNKVRILDVAKAGHDIGVHVHLGNFNEKYESIESYIVKQANLLSTALDYPINKFSIHRPLKKDIIVPINIPGYINMSDTKFFKYTEEFSIYDLPVLYLADSNHEWKYGHPMEIDFAKINKLQLNCHPFSWTEAGLDNWNNFETLTKEKQIEALNSINEEIKTYPVELYEKECSLLVRG